MKSFKTQAFVAVYWTTVFVLWCSILWAIAGNLPLNSLAFILSLVATFSCFWLGTLGAVHLAQKGETGPVGPKGEQGAPGAPGICTGHPQEIAVQIHSAEKTPEELWAELISMAEKYRNDTEITPLYIKRNQDEFLNENAPITRTNIHGKYGDV